MRRRILAYGLLAPAVAFTVILIGYPLIRTLWISIHNYNLLEPLKVRNFVGLEHYNDMLSSSDFWHTVVTSVIYVVSVTSVAYFIGLSLALLTNQRARGISLARTLLSSPWVVPGAIAGFFFVWMFDASFGVINYLVTTLGLSEEPLLWLLRPRSAMLVIILAAVWKTVPFNMLTHLAGLQAIPQDLYEAAHVDGANSWQQFRHITWPALTYVRVVAILITGFHAFREFGQIYVITAGGPSRSTETLSVAVYVEALEHFEFGYASAIGVVMLILSLGFALLTVRFTRSDFY